VKLLKDPNRLARFYTLSSILIGPLILAIGNLAFTRGGGDYCDGAYSLPDGSMDPSRITEFHNAQIFQVICSSAMIAVGLAILIYMLISTRKDLSKLKLWTLLGVGLMMLGYVLVILISSTYKANC